MDSPLQVFTNVVVGRGPVTDDLFAFFVVASSAAWRDFLVESATRRRRDKYKRENGGRHEAPSGRGPVPSRMDGVTDKERTTGILNNALSL